MTYKAEYQSSYCCNLSRLMTKPIMWPVRPAKTQISLGIAVCSVGSWGPNVSSCGQRRLWSDWTHSLCWLWYEAAYFILYYFFSLTFLRWPDLHEGWETSQWVRYEWPRLCVQRKQIRTEGKALVFRTGLIWFWFLPLDQIKPNFMWSGNEIVFKLLGLHDQDGCHVHLWLKTV